MSLRNPAGKNAPEDKNVHNRECSPTDKNSTLPRRYSVESSPLKYSNSAGKCTEKFAETPKIQEQEPYGSGTTGGRNYSPYNDRSTKSDYEAECFSASKSRALRSASLREPRTHYLAPKLDLYSRRSPDSSISDSTSYKNDDSSLSCKNDSLTDHGCKTSSISNPDYSFGISLAAPYSYTPESSTLSKYLSSNKYEVPRSYSPTYGDLEKKTEVKRPSITSRRISRFLRPDFYDKPKEENVYFKEKKEREMETQKVLKEIRDKRKGRLNLRRERSASRESSKTEPESGSESVGKKYDAKSKLAPADESVENLHLPTKPDDIDSRGNKNDLLEDTNSILKDVSASIKNIESNVKVMPNYVNVPNPAANKVSKLTRPKSYPIENLAKKSSPPLKESPEKDTKSKISRLKKGVSPQRSRDKEKTPPKVNSGEKTSNKNRFLQSIEKKFEKLRSFSSPSREGSDKKTKEDKKSSVESAIKRLREQSLPRNIDHCITESGLIKRAVSVEDLSTLGGLGSSTKELQPSRKSVTKILGLFKKYEEKDKKGEKVSKLKKPKEVKAEKTDANKESQLKSKKVTGNKTASKNAASNVKTDENVQVKKSKIPSFNEPPVRNEKQTKECNNKKISESDTKQKVDRPRSLLYDQVKQYQNSYNSAKSDTAITNDSAKSKLSKLPLTSYRRSLNLDNSQTSDPPKFYKNPSKNNINEYCNRNDILNGNESNLSTDINENTEYSKLDRRNLKLDFSKVPIANVSIEPTPSTSTSDNQENCRDNRNSLTTTDDSSAFLSPCDDMSCDSWSVCSDYHTHDVLSPISPNGHIYSGDESESVIDRIRRKSFYTRFNEKKRPKKTSLGGNYRDLDLYKDYSQRKTGYRSPSDYGSLDRRSVDYRPDRRLSYNPVPDSIKKEYKPYTRSSSLLNDYVNVPNRYQTYNPRMNTHNPSLYSPEIEEHAMDDNVSTGKSKINSYYSQPSRTTHRPTSVSPCIENSFIDQRSSSLNQNSVASPTSQSSL